MSPDIGFACQPSRSCLALANSGFACQASGACLALANSGFACQASGSSLALAFGDGTHVRYARPAA